MKPYYEDSHVTIWHGDCIDGMRQLPTESVQCVVTSPPYWGLRDYGVDGAIGLEATPEEYVANMVEVFREVRRVLRAEGTLWLNLGDSYAGSGMTGGTASMEGSAKRTGRRFHGNRRDTVSGLKQKDLVGIPWRVAFALQADGWWLRSDIIWSKPNPMPESIKDRPTREHEYIFLLSKSATYYFDQETVREPTTGNAHSRGKGRNPKASPGGPSSWNRGNGSHDTKVGRYPRPKQNDSWSGAVTKVVSSRNIRTVWE